MFVKPAAGRAVRDPVKGTLLPEDGAEVPESMFWIKRLRDGDVVKNEDSAPVAKVAATTKIADTTNAIDTGSAN